MSTTFPMTPAQKLMYQRDFEFHARRSGFIVRAAMMFDVPCAEVTQAQYLAAYRLTEQQFIPTGSKATT